MSEDRPFVDYYRVLNVNPTCDVTALETAYRHLAKMYHPDHHETADIDRFNEVLEAYRALRNPDQRSQYDLSYSASTGFDFSDLGARDRLSPLSDADAHARILDTLYRRRREAAADAGVGRYFIQESLECSDELFEFHLWYLKAKGLIETTEQGTLAITIEGVDHVIAASRTAVREKLLLSQSADKRDQADL